MLDTPFKLNAGESLVDSDTTQIVPDGGSPHSGAYWLTTLRLVAQWTRSGSLLRSSTVHTITIELGDIAESRTPGGPLVQVVARDGRKLSFQSFQPLKLRQTIAEQVLAYNGGVSTDEAPQPMVEAPPASYHAESSDGSAEPTLCPSCSSTGPSWARFCPHCGRLYREQLTYCRQCDLEFPGHYRFCARCGQTLISAETIRPSVPSIFKKL